MRIEELMTRPVFSCGTEDSLNTAAGLMWDHDCGALPVLNGDGRVAAMITDRDICMAAYTKGKALHDIAVREVAQGPAFTCQPEDALDDVERTMREHRIRRIPVADPSGRPIGIVSLNDVARRTATSTEAGAQHELVETLAAVCKPGASAA
jgi:CBS domain-containing protein